MDVCSFNWELASKFVPLVTPIVSIGIAWFVYYQWHGQKGKEVIANECKDGIKIILESCKLLNDIRNDLSLKPEVSLREKLNQDIATFNHLHRTIIRNLLFINSLIEENSLYNLIVEYNKNHQDMELMLQAKMKFYGINGETYSRLQEFYETYIKNTSRLTETLTKYALYQKTPKLKINQEV